MSKVPSSFDARDWADEFCLIAKEKFGLDIDNGWMIGWFANAIMRGYDERVCDCKRTDVAIADTHA